MQSSLSLRGMIHWWWKLAMIEATASPVSARWRRAVVRDFSLCCSEGASL
jgi:hypothetical protein